MAKLPTAIYFEVPDDYLTEIGRIAIEWAHLEFKVEEAIWALLELLWRTRFEEAKAITTHIPFRVRLDIIGAYARAKPLTEQLITEWDDIAVEVESQHGQRNLVIHHQWTSHHPAFQTIIHRSARRKGTKETYYPATVDNLREIASDITAIRLRLDQWIRDTY